MQILPNIESFPKIEKPIVLTIGSFDGVHLGHLAVLEHVKQTAKKENGISVAMTFANHPSEILRPNQIVQRLCHSKQKLSLLEKAGIDIVILLYFSNEIAEQSAEEFLTKVRSSIPFKYLILGHDATLGKERQGNPSKMQALADHWRFQLEYLPPFSVDGTVVSSTKIRQSIEQGDLQQAQKLLGRPFSIYGTVISGAGKGTQIGFPTANIEVEGLCVPPLGIYAVKILVDKKEYKGVANLGVAPSIHQNRKPILEVHLFDYQNNLYQREVEVIFNSYIRPERKFENIESLKNQIQEDVDVAKNSFKIE